MHEMVHKMVHMAFSGEIKKKWQRRKSRCHLYLDGRGGGICPVVKIDFTPRDVFVLQARSGT
jgi:hypothetical protein